MKRYNPKEIESRWQQYWDEHHTYEANLDSDKQKYLAMSMFNYPSGSGIHIGHAMNYTISDVMARFKRQQGYESYHPVGWDAFGLPAENFAIKSGVSPQQSMAKIIPDYHKQYKAMGWSNDWSKEISTHQPIYYKWTQWIFSEMFRNGLAYQDARMQWWCTKCQTVLANEQVIDGKCWRHDSADDPLVEKKEVKQWFFKITEYAEELLQATDALDWTETVKTAQKNWIGKSKGAEIDFAVEGSDQKVRVFTTRPDTLFGATFMVLAPEHEQLDAIVTTEQKAAVEAYRKEAAKKTEVERQVSKQKTGVFTGAYAVNPINDEHIPIWTSDYVLVGYGTGAIMAVPAHDERDYEFAQTFQLPVTPVIAQDFGTPAENETAVSGVVIVGYDKTTKRFMGLRNPKGSLYLVGGGNEAGEAYVDTARRELAEESGYKVAPESLVQLGDPVYSHYYNVRKNVNRRSFSYAYVAVLSEGEIGDAKREAHEDFTTEWFDFDTLYNGVAENGSGSEHWLEILTRAKQLVDADFESKASLFAEEGVLFNSGAYDGLSSAEAREKIVADLAAKHIATEKINYKIRDWSVSRQRYWGAPIPIINCTQCGPQLVPDEQLPVVLPELQDFQPSGDGRSALARATDWLEVTCPNCGGKGERETDTLDTYICSSWYFLRYADPANEAAPFSKARANKWMPVDFYNGGDHATAHMIYARFVTRFLHKQGLVDDPEPFKKFLFNGKVTASNGEMFSKSKGNGVDPLEIINSGYGADALRTYLMFAAPLELWIRWDEQGVPGAYRFLNRVWNIVQKFVETKDVDDTENLEVLQVIHPAIQKVTADLEDQKYNTAIAAMMKATNDLYMLEQKDGFRGGASWRFALDSLVQMIGPFAPHTMEELWHELAHDDTAQHGHWPQWKDAYLMSDTITIAVQINGKVRTEITVAAEADEASVIAQAKAHDKIKTLLNGEPKRAIYVPKRLVNLVV